MEAGKSLASAILPNLGFQVEDVPVGDGRTADLLVTDLESQRYLIEVKEKIESESQAQQRIEILDRGDLYEQADPLCRDNRISGIFLDAQKQLDATPKQTGTFQLIWFHANGVDADLKLEQAFATFYGYVPLIALSPCEDAMPECFYFDYSAAFHMRTVQALILTEGEKSLQVCLNEFGERVDDFRRSLLCRKFVEIGGIVDPVQMAADGKIIACRADVPRKNEDEVAKALQVQTGILYSPIRLKRHAVSAATRPTDKRERPI